MGEGERKAGEAERKVDLWGSLAHQSSLLNESSQQGDSSNKQQCTYACACTPKTHHLDNPTTQVLSIPLSEQKRQYREVGFPGWKSINMRAGPGTQ